MYFRFFTHIIGFLINIWWQLILIRSSYLCDQNCGEILFKKNRYEFSSASSKYGSTFICWHHTWRDLVYEYSWAKSPMISGYVDAPLGYCTVPLTIVPACVRQCKYATRPQNRMHIWTMSYFMHVKGLTAAVDKQ
jgi:hypothetical protein